MFAYLLIKTLIVSAVLLACGAPQFAAFYFVSGLLMALLAIGS